MKPEHRSLRDVFETIADEARNNPVRHIVALTYEFDDQQLINLLVGRPLDELYEPCGFDLKRIAELTPVVVYDARKTREGQATPHFLELLPVQMPAYTCHHPKALLVVLERSIHLVIGSMNLTRTGLLTNREVFLHLRCNRLETADATVFQEFFSLLESGYASFESEPLARTIAAARDRLAIWNQTAVSTQHLVSSGYGNTGMECMRRLWSEDGRGPALAVLAVSPFFDRASSRRILASELRANFGHFDKLTLVTDASARAHLARSHFAQVAEPVLQLVPAELSQAEMERIARSNDLADLGQRIIQRKLHGKVLALHDGARTLLYVGSANFTCKAWLGENQELGVAWFVDGPWTELVDQICAGFSAAPANVFSLLGDQPDEEAQEDEDYESCAMWPDFVQGVTLEYSVNRQALQFMVRGQELHILASTRCTGVESVSFSMQVCRNRLPPPRCLVGFSVDAIWLSGHWRCRKPSIGSPLDMTPSCLQSGRQWFICPRRSGCPINLALRAPRRCIRMNSILTGKKATTTATVMKKKFLTFVVTAKRTLWFGCRPTCLCSPVSNTTWCAVHRRC